MKDILNILYTLFDIDKDSTKEDIKKSFHKLVQQFHPDKNPEINPNIFIAISKSYELLIDKMNDKDPMQSKPKTKSNNELSEKQIYDFAVEKIKNTFMNILNDNDIDKINFDQIINKIDSLFSFDTEEYNKKNAKIRKQNEDLKRLKTEILSNDDILNITNIVNNLIEKNRQSIMVNKNKIKINREAQKLIKNYDFSISNLLIT